MNAANLLWGQPWVERLGWTLVHFLWQGVLIAALYGAVRRWLGPRSSPDTRYLLACTALAAMVAAPLVTFGLMGSSGLAEPPARVVTVPSAVPASPGDAALLASRSSNSVNILRESVLRWVVMLWLAGAFAFWVRFMGGWVIAASMRSVLVRPAPAEWQHILSKLGTRIAVSRPVRLLVSARVQAPMVVGWLRPVVLVPVGALTGLPPEYVEALLAHELAHIRRHDYLFNVLQSVAEALLFYHPAVWWVSGHIRTERELCCDDVAVSASGDVLTYARALAELESYRPAHLNAAVGANGGSLQDRIGRLLGESRPAARARPGSSVVVTAILLVLTAIAVFGQSPGSPQFEVASIKVFSQGPDGSKPSFEVATVKPNASGENRVAILGQPGGRVVATNVTLKMLMGVAYRVRDFQIFGGPNWINTDRWNIEAKAEEGSIPPRTGPPDPNVPDPMSLMMQSLIEERFQLKMHRDTREMPVYELVVARGGSKLKLSEDQTPFRPPERGTPPPPPQPGGPMPRGMVRFGRGSLETNALPLANLIQALSNQVGRPIIDKTGLSALYDIKLEWTPELGQGPVGPGGPEPPPPAADLSGPSIFTALQEQLGLRLESTRGPVEVLVIESAEKPTDN